MSEINYKAEEVIANVSGMILTILLILSQVTSSEKERFVSALLMLGMGFPFILAIATAITLIVFSPSSEKFIRYLRLAEYASFMLGISFLVIILFVGLKVIGMSAEPIYFMFLVVVVIVLLVYFIEKISDILAKKRKIKRIDKYLK